MSQTTERVQTPLNIAWRGILVSDIWSINKLSILFLQICKKNLMKKKSTKMSNVMVMKILETIPQSQINVLKVANNSVEWKKVSFNSFEYRTTNFTFSHPGTEQCTSSNNSSSNNSSSNNSSSNNSNTEEIMRNQITFFSDKGIFAGPKRELLLN